jgi:UDP-N-acetylglucosamine--N-acetylmuramyl-(pentapeptide) pyrophosphoryl-undecaprenol N-acetylglucosamine transferase
MQGNSKQYKIKVIISGGGTGGHIFPAISIANALKRREPEANILFVGARGKMEMVKVPAAGYPIEGLWISGLQRSLTFKNLLFPLKVFSSLLKARKIINRFKPDVVIGVGGYASGPTLRTASKKKIPTLIQEQNSFPGLTNKILAKNVSCICVAYDGMNKYFPESKIVKTGNPVRQNVIDIDGKRDKAFKFFELDKNKKTILVIGGSQGALSINKAIHQNLQSFIDNNIQLLWQTGKPYYETAIEAAKELKAKSVKVTAFIDRMDYAYAAADTIVSRAGAIAISEICAIGKPTIFIPLPTAAEDHQKKNAHALVEKNAALCIENNEVIDQLGNVAIDLINDINQKLALSSNLKKLAITDADERIVDEILKLADH